MLTVSHAIKFYYQPLFILSQIPYKMKPLHQRKGDKKKYPHENLNKCNELFCNLFRINYIHIYFSVFSQKSLSQQSTFVFVHKILSDISSSSKIKQTAVFFLLCLVANNGKDI